MDIWSIEKKFLAGQELNQSEVGFAENALESPVFDERVVACEALLRIETKLAVRLRVAAKLADLCREVLVTGHLPHTSLILILLLLSREALSDPPFRDFIFFNAVVADSGCRANAVLLLERLARNQDPEAVHVLKDKLVDPDPLVQHNAVSSLGRLKKEGFVQNTN